MCGIAGFMTIDGRMPPASLIDTLASSLAHRGPDGNGRHLAASYYLMQTRLAIIDLVTGDQPIFAPDGTVVAVNGEIYNHVELRAQYAGDSFSTRSDCEMPLHSFRRLGARFAEPLRGMYAIALFDPKEETLYLSRDRFGQKPLYYAEVATGLIFASEPQAILKSGLIVPELSRRAGQELLQLQFTTGRATAFAGINRVLPGETMVVQRGRITGRHFLSALPDTPPEKIGEEEALERLDAALMDSVNVHQRSDVPYGLFFSGGIDSTAILAAMARLNASPVRAFTAGFPGTGVADERAHARALAQRLGAKHTEIEVTEEDFWQTLPLVVSATDDPAADYAIIPTWHLARAAARELKVVLGGEGGDEIFAGYGRYRSVRRPVIFGG
ncbi:MAG TPA: asparagine synthase (glutamine-hydrolyzing), partial [Micropepsaceae bacterium]|nr:asparagine synthase (glutamine-hydrolyzing) [Micropepsaceae bacterium]